MTDRAVPNLPSRDLTLTRDFYARLGFESVYEHDGWLVLRRGTVVLEFFPLPELDPATSDFRCSLYVSDLDELCRAVSDAGVPSTDTGWPRLHPPAVQPWGGRVAFLIDPDCTQIALVDDEGTAD